MSLSLLAHKMEVLCFCKIDIVFPSRRKRERFRLRWIHEVKHNVPSTKMKSFEAARLVCNWNELRNREILVNRRIELQLEDVRVNKKEKYRKVDCKGNGEGKMKKSRKVKQKVKMLRGEVQRERERESERRKEDEQTFVDSQRNGK